MLTVICMASLLSAATGSEQQSAPTPAPSGRLAVVALGGCGQERLAEATRALRAELARLRKEGVLDEARTAEPGGGLPGTTVEELCRSIDAGRTDFLNLRVDAAQASLRYAIARVDSLPLGPRRWEAYWGSRVHLARVLQYLEQKAAASELFLEILRVQEDFTLNRIEFPPSTRELLELTRALMTGLPRFELQVISRQAGQPVYVNGFLIGKTPFARRMVSGEYEVVVGEGERRSFSRDASLHSDLTLEFDLEREAGFHPERGPCFEAAASPEAMSARSAALATALGVDELVVVALESKGDESQLAVALLRFEGGELRQVREGRVGLAPKGLPRLDRLAAFVLTGEPMTTALAAALPAVEDPIEPASASPEDSQWSRSGVSAIAFGAAALLLGGLGLYEHFEMERLEGAAQALRQDDGTLSYLDKEQHDVLLERSAQARRLRNGLATGAAAATAGSGIFLGMALAPDSRSELAFSVGIGGSF